MKNRSKVRKITAREFDKKFDRGEDITKYLDLKNATRIRRINVDFPDWMVRRLDEEARKLNISRQAVVKTWVYQHLSPHHS